MEIKVTIARKIGDNKIPDAQRGVTRKASGSINIQPKQSRLEESIALNGTIARRISSATLQRDKDDAQRNAKTQKEQSASANPATKRLATT